jgi:hypothetical protein
MFKNRQLQIAFVFWVVLCLTPAIIACNPKKTYLSFETIEKTEKAVYPTIGITPIFTPTSSPTPNATRIDRPLPAYKPMLTPFETPKPVQSQLGAHPVLLFRKLAGVGTITESGSSIFHSDYRINNNWSGEINGDKIVVYAGAHIDYLKESEYLNPKAWEGVLAFVVTNSKGNFLPSKGGVYIAPDHSGALRIVDAVGTTLILVAENGVEYTFDVNNRQYQELTSRGVFQRSLSWGNLVESKNVPYPIRGYSFENYWTVQKDSRNVLWVFAGVLNNDPQQGALVVIETTADGRYYREETIYMTPFRGDALRIVDINNHELSLVNHFGSIFIFNLDSRIFTKKPSGSKDTAQVIYIIKQGQTISTTPITMAPLPQTPTITPSNTPTITALPTYSPQ